MDKFKKKYLEEANELVQKLEAALLDINIDDVEESIIQEIFRIMHTIKGNSAMFGYKRIDEFTHHLETIYDLVRNKKAVLSNEIIDFSFIAIDHIKLLLCYENDLPSDVNSIHEDLLKKVIKTSEDILDNKKTVVEEKKVEEKKNVDIIEEKSEHQEDDNSINNAIAEEVDKPSDPNAKSVFYILFEPKQEIFKFGNNPLFLIEDLTNLGKALVFPKYNKIPDFDNINPEFCYTDWEILLSTDEDINAIKDVFIFVEDDCKIIVEELGEVNIFKSSIKSKLEEIGYSEKYFELDQLKIILGDNENEIDNKKVEAEPDNSEEQEVNNVPNDIPSKENPVVKPKAEKNGKIKTNIFKETISSIRVDSDKLDVLMNLISEMVTLQARLNLYANESESPELAAISENLEKVSRRLRDTAFNICLIPLETMLTRFQRLVRDVSAELNKDVKFVTEGSETELDKSIIESLADPIMHILRNSLDHGLESPEERERLGKPKTGIIKLQAYYSGTYVYIAISDDGKGIKPEMIREKAIGKGIISPDEVLSKKETINLVFAPGLSTATKITDLSGRGVGMDVVKRKIADIRGEVDIDSEINVGTTITIRLPLTLSIIDGLLVEINETLYIIPLTVVNFIFSAPKSKIKRHKNIIVHNGEEIPYIYLRDEFQEREDDFSDLQFVVVNYSDFKVGLVIDTIVGEYQAVLKPIGKIFKEQDFVSGATILGDGSVALVLDTNRIVRQYVSTTKAKATN